MKYRHCLLTYFCLLSCRLACRLACLLAFLLACLLTCRLVCLLGLRVSGKWLASGWGAAGEQVHSWHAAGEQRLLARERLAWSG